MFDGRKAGYAPHARTVMIAHRAITRFRQREFTEKNLAVRIEVSAAISSLILISYALDKNASFLRVNKQPTWFDMLFLKGDILFFKK